MSRHSRQLADDVDVPDVDGVIRTNSLINIPHVQIVTYFPVTCLATNFCNQTIARAITLASVGDVQFVCMYLHIKMLNLEKYINKRFGFYFTLKAFHEITAKRYGI